MITRSRACVLRDSVPPTLSGAKSYEWAEIGRVPQVPGVYAWYYRPEITEFDLQGAVAALSGTADIAERRTIVREFLDRTLLQFFHEEPYSATIRGALKPKYEGELVHMQALSDSLVDRVASEPERLHTIKTVVESSAPHFASPLYIGMSERLGERLATHKALITRYRDSGRAASAFASDESGDSTFAVQVCKRRIAPNRLFVVTRPIHTAGNRYVDIENLLNRIHYPLFGKN